MNGFDLKSINVGEMKQFCTPSPFYDLIRKERRLDPGVRLAMECPASRMKVVVRSLTLRLSGI